MWGSQPSLRWVDFCGVSVLQFVSHPPTVMGFDFTLIALLLPSHCGFFFVFGCGVSFLVSSSVFLSMIVQQLVVILVFSQEGVRARPSIPPSWFLSQFQCLLNKEEVEDRCGNRPGSPPPNYTYADIQTQLRK